MTTLPSTRQEIDEAILLTPLSEGDGVGKYLRYDPLYDQIKDARREDDVTLSQGIWQTEIKRADWPLVETLCLDALTTKTKDLDFRARFNLGGVENDLLILQMRVYDRKRLIRKIGTMPKDDFTKLADIIKNLL